MDSLVISSEAITNEIKRRGASLVGIADVTELKETQGIRRREFKKYSRAISIGFRLSDDIINGIADGPTLEYAQHYREVNKKLDSIKILLEKKLLEEGYIGREIPD